MHLPLIGSVLSFQQCHYYSLDHEVVLQFQVQTKLQFYLVSNDELHYSPTYTIRIVLTLCSLAETTVFCLT